MTKAYKAHYITKTRCCVQYCRALVFYAPYSLLENEEALLSSNTHTMTNKY